MEINPLLLKIDPSRYTVYQMLDYIKGAAGLELVQKKTDNLFLFKTDPFVESLYNYAHVLSNKFTAADLEIIKEFFGAEKFRLKIPENKEIADFLLTAGFKLKDTGYIMVAEELDNKNYDCQLPENIDILAADTPEILAQVKSVFMAAFNYPVSGYEKKFGFLDEKMLAKNDRHINSFILYENGAPVATGAYYAFDKFSVENIGTLEAARGRGYAGLIMRHLLREAQKLNYTEACLTASEAARRVYEKAGFVSLARTATYIP